VKPARLAFTIAAVLATAAARAESPRIGSFEIGAGQYRPNIDDGLGASGPYERVFGDDRGWMFRAGISRTLLNRVGALDVGFRTGYFRQSGKAVFVSDGTRSSDDTAFNVVPTSITLTYRLDYFADRYPVPLAPYARVAFERYNWWVSGGDGKWSKEGATNGWSWTGGLALQLDFFDRQSARELDVDIGVNHTYLFFDATRTYVDDFGSSKSWDLSDDEWSFSGGLLFVF
jgi:hypothetical protein